MTMTPTPASASPRAALVVVAAGVSAALHVGKLPPAIPVLHEALGVTLVEAGFLLSLLQFAGMATGVFIGLFADAIGARRTVLGGLLVLGVAGALSAASRDAPTLLAMRAVEGAGFLLATLPAPALIRRVVAERQIASRLGWWGAYMPTGVALGLLAGPPFLQRFGWQAWWLALAAATLLAACCVALMVPGDASNPRPRLARAAPPREPSRLGRTLGSFGPWLLGFAFACYSGQWLAVVGFLPSIYAQAGVVGATAGPATALVAAANLVGNVVAGRLLQRGVAARALLRFGYASMAVGALLAFVAWPGLPATLRFVAVVAFSMCGGLVPATLFASSMRLAPDARSLSTTVGFMHQWSSAGQFVGPPLVALLASRAGGWQWSWVVTAAASAIGWLVAGAIGARLAAARAPIDADPRRATP